MAVTTRSLFFATALGAATTAHAADLNVVSKVSGTRGGGLVSTQSVSDGKIRLSENDFDSIFNVVSGRVLILDGKAQTYYETSLAEIGARREAVEAMRRSPASARPAAPPSGPVTVRKGTVPKTIAGYECDQYTLTLGDAVKFEVWAARNLEAPARYVEAEQLLLATRDPAWRRFDAIFDEMKKIKGFPIVESRWDKLAGAPNRYRREATQVKAAPLPASTFEAPAGYRRKDSPYKQVPKAIS